MEIEFSGFIGFFVHFWYRDNKKYRKRNQVAFSFVPLTTLWSIHASVSPWPMSKLSFLFEICLKTHSEFLP